MYRMIAVVVITASAAGLARSDSWQLENSTIIHADGTWPSLWDGTVAYVVGNSGPVMFYDGVDSVEIYGPTLLNYEPAHANGSIAWRNATEYDAGTNEILLWDGVGVVNVSQTPGVIDSNLTAGSNGDLMWSQDNTWLVYYDGSSGTTTPLGIRGVHPALYIADGGVATYAYQDPDTYEVKYFDGATTQVLGMGATYGAMPSVWDGAVAWTGEGQGSMFDTAELFFWKDGQAVRVTDDDAVDGISDRYASVWNDVVIWTRYVYGSFQPRLFLWDGSESVQLTSSSGKYPSYHQGQVSWLASDGLHIADVAHEFEPLRGDMNCDGGVDFGDINPFVLRLSDPAGYLAQYPDCPDANGDINEDGEVDFGDINPFVALLSGFEPQRGDMNCDGDVDFGDINPFVLRLSDPAGYQTQYPDCPDANGDINEDGEVDFGDINAFVALLSG